MAAQAIRNRASAATVALFLQAGADAHDAGLLAEAARSYDPLYLIEFLRVGVSPNAFLPRIEGCSLLLWLLARGADPSLVLLKACEKIDMSLSAVTASLEAGAKADAVDSNGRSALHLLLMSDCYPTSDAVKLLIKAGANINAVDQRGESVLGVALRLCLSFVARDLIRAGADVRRVSSQSSCFELSAQRQDRHVDWLFKEFVCAGADVTVTDRDGNTPLHLLARLKSYSTDVVKVLVDAGVKIDCVNARGETPLMCALSAPCEATAKFVSALLSLGASVDSRSVDNGYTVCHFAAELCDRELMSTLIDTFGVDVNATSKDGRTPLMIACAKSAWDIVALLLAAGARPHAGALHSAISAARSDIVEALIAASADVCASDKHGWTPCHYAVALGNTELFDRLVAAGASVNVGGESLVHIATISSIREASMQRLVAAGADLNAINGSGQTPCHVAAAFDKPAILRVLIDAGAVFDVLDNNGSTALTKAVERGSRECVALLLAAGANATRVDQRGQTLLHVLLSGLRFDPMLVRALAAHGVDVNARDSSGLSAVDRVAERGDGVGCLCALFAVGAEVMVASESTRLALVRARGAEVCIGLQSMRVPALQLTEIIRFACASVSDDVPFHQLWSIATTIKHSLAN
jgi:ankyrin repeat protein